MGTVVNEVPQAAISLGCPPSTLYQSLMIAVCSSPPEHEPVGTEVEPALTGNR